MADYGVFQTSTTGSVNEPSSRPRPNYSVREFMEDHETFFAKTNSTVVSMYFAFATAVDGPYFHFNKSLKAFSKERFSDLLPCFLKIRPTDRATLQLFYKTRLVFGNRKTKDLETINALYYAPEDRDRVANFITELHDMALKQAHV